MSGDLGKQGVKNLSIENKRENQTSSIYSSAAGMGFGTLLSRILGLVRDALLAAFFSKFILDCFAIGFRLPNFFRRVMGEGALSVSFIPQYLNLKIQDPKKAEELRNVMFTFLFTLALIISALGILYLDKILYFIIYRGDTAFSREDFLAAVQMGRWMFAFLFLITQFAYFMSVLNANKRFWVAGVAPALFNFGFIAFIFFPEKFVLFSGQQLALGVLFGGFLQAALVSYSYIKNFGAPKLNFAFNFKPFRKVLLATLPSLLGIGVLQFISIININLAARTGTGSNAFLYFADRIMELPQSLIAVSLGTAMLPSLSEMWVKSREDFDSTLVGSLRVYLYFALPAGLGLFFLSLPITQLLFERGSFTYEKSLAVAMIVQIYGGLLVVSGIARMLLPIYYSFKNTWYPALMALIVLCSHYIVGNYFVADLNLGLQGIALTTLISATLNFVFLILGLKIFIQRSYLLDIVKALVHFMPSVVILGGLLWFVARFLQGEQSPTKILATALCISASVLVYYFVSFIFGVKESRLIWSLVRKVIR